jgi:hypothetical protein
MFVLGLLLCLLLAFRFTSQARDVFPDRWRFLWRYFCLDWLFHLLFPLIHWRWIEQRLLLYMFVVLVVLGFFANGMMGLTMRISA